MIIDTNGMFILKALGHGFLLTMVSYFLDEIIEMFVDYSPKSFVGLLV